MFLVQMPDGTFLVKNGGVNNFTRDPKLATSFRSKEDAEAAKPGHHRDMGGTGFKGRVLSRNSVS